MTQRYYHSRHIIASLHFHSFCLSAWVSHLVIFA
uniref:Uncharacterized protein n=1 Tax=Anguilla anguilla TaxID=7936 RepID=A0A0E9PNX7_ANGAN